MGENDTPTTALLFITYSCENLAITDAKLAGPDCDMLKKVLCTGKYSICSNESCNFWFKVFPSSGNVKYSATGTDIIILYDVSEGITEMNIKYVLQET